MEITGYDDTSLTSYKTRLRADALGQSRFEPGISSFSPGARECFMMAAAPRSLCMIKMDGQQTQIDAVGIYSSGGDSSLWPDPGGNL